MKNLLTTILMICFVMLSYGQKTKHKKYLTYEQYTAICDKLDWQNYDLKNQMFPLKYSIRIKDAIEAGRWVDPKYTQIQKDSIILDANKNIPLYNKLNKKVEDNEKQIEKLLHIRDNYSGEWMWVTLYNGRKVYGRMCNGTFYY